jgi:hypothetical protein
MKFLERFSKFQQIFFYKLFSAEGQTETETEIMHRKSQFHTTSQNCAANQQKTYKISGLLAESAADYGTLRSVRST